VAKQAGLTTAGLTGFAGGQMRGLCDACIVVPSDNMQMIEDLHLCIAHSLFTCIQARIAGQKQAAPVERPFLVPRTVQR
jgi:D-sedoheptulose 7-phosphate isomerase